MTFYLLRKLNEKHWLKIKDQINYSSEKDFSISNFIKPRNKGIFDKLMTERHTQTDLKAQDHRELTS